jgi:hypothetical protein
MRVFIILALICTSALHAQEVYTDNVVIVLDASGSMDSAMHGTSMLKIVAAKQALHQVLVQVPQSTHIGLLVFGASNIRDHWVYPLGPRDNGKLKTAIDLPKPKGNTPLGKYIKIGADRLLDAREKQFGYGSYRLLVVTDGEASDQKVMEKNTQLLLHRGVITLDVIGVSMKGSHSLARMSHSYRRANDPASLAQAIKEVFAEVSTGDSSDSGESVFDEIASLPASFATGALSALATTGNQPIGDHAAISSPRVQAPSHAPPPRRLQHVTPSSRRGRSPWFTVILVLVGIAFITKVIKRTRH